MGKLTIDVPKGYTIDNENSTFDHIVLKPIKNPTYKEICEELMPKEAFYIDIDGIITCDSYIGTYSNASPKCDILEKLLAINKLANIAYYYNEELCKYGYAIYYADNNKKYQIKIASINFGDIAIFKTMEIAQKVIDNPNFRNILNTIYK